MNDPETPASTAGQPLMWKGRPRLYVANGIEIYDMRARGWCPQAGVFLMVDGFKYADARTTLGGWPGQNPLRWTDPSGHTAVPIVYPGFVPGGQPQSFGDGLPLGHAGVVLINDQYRASDILRVWPLRQRR